MAKRLPRFFFCKDTMQLRNVPNKWYIRAFFVTNEHKMGRMDGGNGMNMASRHGRFIKFNCNSVSQTKKKPYLCKRKTETEAKSAVLRNKEE